ncbi:phosphatases II, partial [Morchella conica CCBAS932]
MPPKVSFVEPDCTCRASDHPTTPVRTQSCHRHHPPNMDEILPGLFLGNLTAAESAEHLSKHGITHVLSVTSSCPLVPQGYVHKYHNLHDDHSADLLAVLPDLMKARHYTLDAALTHVVAQRPIVRPNSSFMRQLRAWEGAGCSPWVREELAAI